MDKAGNQGGEAGPTDSRAGESRSDASVADELGDLATVVSSVADTAVIGSGLWVSYVFFLFYLAVAAGSVTHRDLLMENPLRLPLLDVDLPLVAFFVLAPVLFVVLHVYTLIHFGLLGIKVRHVSGEIHRQVQSPERQAAWQRQLPSDIFVQLLAGPQEVRRGIFGKLLLATAGLTLIIAPILLILLMQAQFLAFHNEAVTWIHRACLFADLVAIFLLWPVIVLGEPGPAWRAYFRGWGGPAAALVLLAMSLCVATFPGEWLDRWLPSIPLLRPAPAPTSPTRTAAHRLSIYDLLFNGAFDPVREMRSSLFSNTIVAPDVDVIDHRFFDSPESYAKVARTISLRGRNLTGAVLNGADLRRVDFVGANLDSARLAGADLRGATITCLRSSFAGCAKTILRDGDFSDAQLEGAILNDADFSGSVLTRAHMERASMERADLAGVDLAGAELEGADLSFAHLAGANLRDAHLKGAILREAKLWGADITGGHLQGADLSLAHLDGASLVGGDLRGGNLGFASLAGADLGAARLEGARFNGAVLQGADFNGAAMSAASFEQTQLQGTNLLSATTFATSFDGAYVWRASPPAAPVAGTVDQKNFVRANQINTEAKYVPDPIAGGASTERDWTKASYEALLAAVVGHLPAGQFQDEALDRIARLDPGKPDTNQKEAMAAWSRLAANALAEADYKAALAGALIDAACRDRTGSYVILGLLSSDRRGGGSPQVMRLREAGGPVIDAFLDPTTCIGARDLTDADREVLADLKRTFAATGNAAP